MKHDKRLTTLEQLHVDPLRLEEHIVLGQAMDEIAEDTEALDVLNTANFAELTMEQEDKLDAALSRVPDAVTRWGQIYSALVALGAE